MAQRPVRIKSTLPADTQTAVVRCYSPHDAQFPELHVEQLLPPPGSAAPSEPAQKNAEKTLRRPTVPQVGHCT